MATDAKSSFCVIRFCGTYVPYCTSLAAFSRHTDWKGHTGTSGMTQKTHGGRSQELWFYYYYYYYYYYLLSYKKYKHWKTINTTIQTLTKCRNSTKCKKRIKKRKKEKKTKCKKNYSHCTTGRRIPTHPLSYWQYNRYAPHYHRM